MNKQLEENGKSRADKYILNAKQQVKIKYISFNFNAKFQLIKKIAKIASNNSYFIKKYNYTSTYRCCYCNQLL